MRAVLLSGFFVFWLAAGPMIHWRGDYDRALAESRQSGRPMLVVLVRRHSFRCAEQLRRLGEDAALVRLLNRSFVPVIVTEENGAYPVELLYSTVYPTIFLLSPRETFLMPPLPGGADPSGVRMRLEEKLSDE